MPEAFCFVENCLKPRIVVTFNKEAEELPNSEVGWDLRERIDASTVTPDMSLAGVGNTAEIIQRVHENGSVVMSGDPGT